jgi:hypothetical protein
MNVGAETPPLSFLYRQFIDFLPRDFVAVKKATEVTSVKIGAKLLIPQSEIERI